MIAHFSEGENFSSEMLDCLRRDLLISGGPFRSKVIPLLAHGAGAIEIVGDIEAPGDDALAVIKQVGKRSDQNKETIPANRTNGFLSNPFGSGKQPSGRNGSFSIEVTALGGFKKTGINATGTECGESEPFATELGSQRFSESK